MKNAFISYRRQDSPGYVRALYDRLVHHFGSNKVFMDVDDIQLGSDFVNVLDNNLKGCAVMLVVIGNDWLTATNAAGERRLDNSADFVRLEVSRALQRGISVIPILVSGAQMPSEDDLPDDLKPLARRQALELNNKNYDYSIRDLVKALEKYLGKAQNSSDSKKTEEDTSSTVPWYKHRSLVYLWLLIAPPVGLYGLWKSSDMSNVLKVALGLTPIIIMVANLELWVGLAFMILVPAALIYLWVDKEINKKTKILYTVFSSIGAITFAALLQNIFFPEQPPTDTTNSNNDVTTGTTTNAPPSMQAGFDCNMAGSVAEKAICASDEARQADKKMVNAYRAFEAKTPPAEHDAMWKLQKVWLLERDSHIEHNCLKKSTEEQTSKCIATFYGDRTKTLKTYLSSQFMHMRVFDPPSNIRKQPNGSILCKAAVKNENIVIYIIPVTDKNDDSWYWTEYCGKGQWGLIHDSQIRPQ